MTWTSRFIATFDTLKSDFCWFMLICLFVIRGNHLLFSRGVSRRASRCVRSTAPAPAACLLAAPPERDAIGGRAHARQRIVGELNTGGKVRGQEQQLLLRFHA